MTLYIVLIVAVGLERVAELVVSKRNLAWAMARGGREYGFGHYPFMIVLHTGLLAACLVEAAHRPFIPALGWSMLAAAVLAQALRWWCITVLGPRWNTALAFTVINAGLLSVRIRTENAALAHALAEPSPPVEIDEWTT